MAGATSPDEIKGVARREYLNPPVHEVILDVQFQRDLEQDALRDLPRHLSKIFPRAEQQNIVQLQVAMGVGSGGYQNSLTQFGGWLFREDGWVLQTGLTSWTLHLVRPGNWPTGRYLGWTAIYEKFLELHSVLKQPYGNLEPKRAGLRYLNRVAIPLGDDIARWLAFRNEAPALLHDLYAFNLRHTWARAGEDDDLSATLGLAKINIDEPLVARDNQGVLLDIDVFNLLIDRAPSYEGLPDWFKRAHAIENEIFEECLTASLRERFDRT